MNLQLPMQGLSFTPLGGNSYTLSSSITPMVQVNYLDNTSVQRAKFVQAPMQLMGTVSSSADPSSVVWWAFMENGSISNPVLSGNTLSFAAETTISVIAIPGEPANFPVVQGLTCSQQLPVQVQCKRIYPLESYCLLSGGIPGMPTVVIPFVPLGPVPYTNPVATPLGGQPYVLRIVPLAPDSSSIDFAFPVTLNYLDGNGQTQSQSTFLFMSLVMSGIAAGPNTRIIADLTATFIVTPSTVTPPVLFPSQVFIAGNIAAIDAGIQVPTTNTVQCGAVAISTCQPVPFPPTLDITG